MHISTLDAYTKFFFHAANPETRTTTTTPAPAPVSSNEARGVSTVNSVKKKKTKSESRRGLSESAISHLSVEARPPESSRSIVVCVYVDTPMPWLMLCFITSFNCKMLLQMHSFRRFLPNVSFSCLNFVLLAVNILNFVAQWAGLDLA